MTATTVYNIEAEKDRVFNLTMTFPEGSDQSAYDFYLCVKPQTNKDAEDTTAVLDIHGVVATNVITFTANASEMSADNKVYSYDISRIPAGTTANPSNILKGTFSISKTVRNYD